ncbi:hypothetical protein F4680DRAFT_463105 [Xylaria scruposa]|nr:hypothetical protein F4680DRAFT_463105 [Xylaria scruposa]
MLPAVRNSAVAVLCWRCQGFNIQIFSRNTVSWRGYRISDIVTSAKSGCPFCCYLARGLEEAGHIIYRYIKNTDDDWVHFRVLRAVQDLTSQSRHENTGLNVTYLQVFDWNGVGFGLSGSQPLLEFHVVADLDDPASTSGDVAGRYTRRDSSSQELIDAVKSWLASCDSHTSCSCTLSGQPITLPMPLPTRCLQLYIRLVETTGKTGSYTTLSHRWPIPPKQIRGATTSANLADRLESREALQLTLRLGYEYIWIDAVCIIQGTKDPSAKADWAYEASRMATYYQNSRLTIAATHGDEETGLFNSETPESSRPLIKMPYRGLSGHTSPPSFFYLVPSDNYWNQDYTDYVGRSNLLTRGWVFQEWVLSRRILSYTPASVYFQCMVQFPRNEDGTVMTMRKYGETEQGETTTSIMSLNRWDAADLHLKNLSLSYDKETIYKQWIEIVEAYSRQHLTRPETDKLMATVGVAKEFGVALLSDSDLADIKRRVWVGGSWLGDILRSLLWEQASILPTSATGHSSESHDDAGRIREVPSWSWASRRAGVEWVRVYGVWRFDGTSRLSCEVTAVRDAGTRHTQSESVEAETPEAAQRPDDDSESFLIDGNYGVQPHVVNPTQTFPVLCIRARLASVLVRELYVDGDESDITRLLSDHSGRGNLRKVALPSSKERICGWVSLDKEQNVRQTESRNNGHGEHNGASSNPALLSQGDVETGQAAPGEETQVLLVSTRDAQEGGYFLGYGFMGDHPIYLVLFVRRYPHAMAPSENGFERIGVGRLFGKRVQKLFEDTEAQEVLLF